MGLYIRDKTVDQLARQVQSAIDAPTKTDAVRIALQNELARLREGRPLVERVKRLQLAYKSLGDVDPNFDMKKFMDEGWDGL